MKAIAILALALATSGCGGIHDYRPSGDAISYEDHGYSGRGVSWRIHPNGEVTYTSFQPVQNNDARQQSVTRTFRVSEEDYNKIHELMRKAARFRGEASHAEDYGASRSIPCDRTVTDHGKGTVVWHERSGKFQLVRVDFGCQSDESDALEADLRSANALMRGWAERAPATGS